MNLARVRGTVVATKRADGMDGARWLLVEECDPAGGGRGEYLVALDMVGAERGQTRAPDAGKLLPLDPAHGGQAHGHPGGGDRGRRRPGGERRNRGWRQRMTYDEMVEEVLKSTDVSALLASFDAAGAGTATRAGSAGSGAGLRRLCRRGRRGESGSRGAAGACRPSPGSSRRG